MRHELFQIDDLDALGAAHDAHADLAAAVVGEIDALARAMFRSGQREAGRILRVAQDRINGQSLDLALADVGNLCRHAAGASTGPLRARCIDLARRCEAEALVAGTY